MRSRRCTALLVALLGISFDARSDSGSSRYLNPKDFEGPVRKVFLNLRDAVLRGDKKLYAEQFLPGAYEENDFAWMSHEELFTEASTHSPRTYLEPIVHLTEVRSAHLLVVQCMRWASEVELAVDLEQAVLVKRDTRWLLAATSGDSKAIEKYVRTLHGSPRIPRRTTIDVKALLVALHDADEVVRWRAAGDLNLAPTDGLYGVVPALVAAVKEDESAAVRWEALGSLHDLASLHGLGPVQSIMFGTAMHALKDDDKIVRCSAANSLQKFGAIDKPGLLAAAKDSDARVRAGAIAAIGALYDELEAPSSLLLEALSDSDALVRARAAYVISVLDSQIPNAKNALERLAQDPDERVRWLVRDIEEPTSDH
jgi:hypothetical protein